jgi:hypothetical protein
VGPDAAVRKRQSGTASTSLREHQNDPSSRPTRRLKITGARGIVKLGCGWLTLKPTGTGATAIRAAEGVLASSSSRLNVLWTFCSAALEFSG